MKQRIKNSCKRMWKLKNDKNCSDCEYYPYWLRTIDSDIWTTAIDTISTAVLHYINDHMLNAYRPRIYLTRYQTIEMPWLFDYDEPWKAPVHYQHAPVRMSAKSATIKKFLTVLKQPISRSGFRRGQRV